MAKTKTICIDELTPVLLIQTLNAIINRVDELTTIVQEMKKANEKRRPELTNEEIAKLKSKMLDTVEGLSDKFTKLVEDEIERVNKAWAVKEEDIKKSLQNIINDEVHNFVSRLNVEMNQFALPE